jgi:hypothetical protein
MEHAANGQSNPDWGDQERLSSAEDRGHVDALQTHLRSFARQYYHGISLKSLKAELFGKEWRAGSTSSPILLLRKRLAQRFKKRFRIVDFLQSIGITLQLRERRPRYALHRLNRCVQLGCEAAAFFLMAGGDTQ